LLETGRKEIRKRRKTNVKAVHEQIIVVSLDEDSTYNNKPSDTRVNTSEDANGVNKEEKNRSCQQPGIREACLALRG
jgi:hypothetical protein